MAIVSQSGTMARGELLGKTQLGRMMTSTGLDDVMEAALWTGLYYASEDSEPEELDGHCHNIFDIPNNIWEELQTDWESFRAHNADDIREFCDTVPCGIEQVAHDFHLTRNGHGAGFWDRGAGDVGGRLTKAAHVYGTAEIMGWGSPVEMELTN